jgi:ABC-type lipoprotein release transport system permease subunit
MLKMAFRNIFRQKRRSLLTALTMFGGFILCAVAIGFMDGTFKSIVDTFTRSRLGHIQIHAQGYLNRPSLNKTISNYRDVGRVIDRTPEAEAWAPRVYSAGLASAGDRTDSARIIGIDPALEVKATRFDKKITQGRVFSAAAAREIILGKGLAQNLKVAVGGDVVLVSQGADGSLANDRYRLIGLVETGDLATDRTTAYLHIDDARELLVLGDRVHEVVVIARSLDKVAGLTDSLRNELSAFSLDVQSWQVFAKSFYLGMQAKMKGNGVIQLVVFIIVAIGVLNTALMAVLERRREYGLLKAVGTRPRQIFALIILEIYLLALMSIILGVGISLPLNYYLSQHQISIAGMFSQQVTFGGMDFKTFTSEVNLRSFVIPALTVFVSAFLVSLMPAVKAARTDPAKSLSLH